MAKSVQIPAEQRVEAVMAILTKSETMAALSRRLKVSEATLYRWRDEFIANGKRGIAGGDRKGNNGNKSEIAQLKREIESRDQIIGELTIANRILKKTVFPG
jgi:transposase-like protein